ncbi:PrsW family glutamic-type intramembrane protease [Candidatus Bipolaricaulota bacterium]
MSLFLQSTYLSAALSLVYIYLLYRSHPFRRIPSGPTLLAFAVGMVAVVPVVAFRRVVPLGPIESSVWILILAAAIEEGAKLLVALATIWRYRFPNVVEPLDFAIYFGVLGVGFGIYEDFWYIFSATYTSWIAGDIGRFNEVFRGIALARAFPGHILFNGIAGFLLGYAFFANGARRRGWILGGLSLAILLHVGFNWIATVGETPLLITYIVLLVGVFLGLRRREMGRSPFAALIRYTERGESGWRFDRAPIAYLFADGFDWPGKRRGGFFQFYPVAFSLCVLFPLLLIGVYFVNRALLLIGGGS